MKKILFSLALMSALLVSCEPENGEDNQEPTPEPEYSISISPAELTFGAEGGEQSVTVTSSNGWYLNGESDWCEVSASYGESGDEILIKVKPNADTENSRTAKLVFTCGDKTAELTINQQKDEIIEFKDPAFLQAVLRDNFADADKNGDKKISKAEAALVTEMRIDANVYSDGTSKYPRTRVMDEIKYFTALTSLECSDNQLISLDLSNNTALTYLNCSDNQLTTLDVSKNTALTYLSCYSNQLTTLDVSKNTALTYLGCSDNQLTSLDVSGCIALEDLKCRNNQLTSLDVSKHTALTSLNCDGNQLTSLDVSNNTELIWLSCYSNDITTIDVSMCRGLEYFNPVSYSMSGTLPREIYPDYETKLPLESLKIYKYHIISDNDISAIKQTYGDILEYVE